MDDSRNVLDRVRAELDRGNYSLARGLLLDLVGQGNPEALFLSSTFSVSGQESDQEFERRSIRELSDSSAKGYPPAQYAFAVCLESGDMVDPDSERAAVLFKAAAEAGYSKAKFSHGLNLYYGSSGIPKEPQLGLSYLRQAEKEGVEAAADFLRKLKESGLE